jgi:hypothetical protein
MLQENFKPVLENGNTGESMVAIKGPGNILTLEQMQTHPAAKSAKSMLDLARKAAARS